MTNRRLTLTLHVDAVVSKAFLLCMPVVNVVAEFVAFHLISF